MSNILLQQLENALPKGMQIPEELRQYNHTYIFNELAKINDLRNRIAHHEPICFLSNNAIIDTNYTRQRYNLILQLFTWMNINSGELLYGLDHIQNVCNEIDELKN